MVKIVTGNMNSGKTTRILELFNQNKTGDGFIQLKTMTKAQVHHYDVLHLQSNTKKTIAYHQDFYQNQFTKPLCFGPYVFNQTLFKEIENCIEAMLKENQQPIYLDEVGMLEINQKGYASILKKILAQKVDLIMVVKESLISEIKEHFKIGEIEIIR